MGQKGFFDIAQRYAGLDAKNDPLARIDEVVPWEDFRPRLEAAWRKPTEERKSPAGRKPWDAVVMFKAIVLCELYNLSDDQVEYQLRDRLSFMRFLGLGLEDKVPDAQTVWLYREQLAQAGVIETLFEDFDGYLEQQGYLAMGGQIIDASIVPVPKQRNSGDDNARIKEGETPEGWENQPAKRSQKDTDARWTKKHGKSHYGYKNHVNVDRRHKLVRRYRVTDAAVHDSQIVDDILDPDNTASDVWADSAYRSAATARSSPSIIQPPHPLSPTQWKTLSTKGPKLSARIWKNISRKCVRHQGFGLATWLNLRAWPMRAVS